MISSDGSVRTKRRALGQVVLCSGCCCGRTEKGRPYLPDEKIKAIWKSERLYKSIQLTISGCLGPCDVANVVQIVTPSGTEWFGRLDQDSHYEALIDWARSCHSAKELLPRPSSLAVLRFDGYIAEPSDRFTATG